LKTLLRPFLFSGLICTALIYVNTEWFFPKALGIIKHIDTKHSNQKSKHRGLPSVQHIILEDGSTVLFHHYDSASQMFADAYWINNLNEIYRFKYLYPYAEIPMGMYVDHFARDQNGKLIQLDSQVQRLLPGMRFNRTTLMETLTPMEDL